MTTKEIILNEMNKIKMDLDGIISNLDNLLSKYQSEFDFINTQQLGTKVKQDLLNFRDAIDNSGKNVNGSEFFRLKKNAGLDIKEPSLNGIESQIMDILTIKPLSINGYIDLDSSDIIVSMNNDDVIECTYLNKESDNSASITINGTVVSNTIGENLAETLGEVYKNYLKK